MYKDRSRYGLAGGTSVYIYLRHNITSIVYDLSPLTK